MNQVDYFQLFTLSLPEIVLVFFALLVLAVDLMFLRGETPSIRRITAVSLSSAGCLLAIFLTLVFPREASVLEGVWVANPLIQWVKAALLVLTVFTLLSSMRSEFTDHVGEYFLLVLLAASGMLFMVGTEDLLLVFVALELLSLSLYILTAFNRNSAGGTEAALKYFLFGSMAAAFTLFGLSLVYGAAGGTSFHQIAASLKGAPLTPLLAIGLVMVLMGFGFKVAAVPFHLWAPDVYAGAPIPSAAFIASGSKVASFFVFGKLLLVSFAGVEGAARLQGYIAGWSPALMALAAGSILIGNIGAIAQQNARRLIAYSAVAHSGYTLLALLADPSHALMSLLFYSVTYGLTVIGAFAIIGYVEEKTGSSQLTSFAGLARHSPLLAFCLMIFILSLAGIPPLAGFFGKFYLFAAALAGEKDLLFLWIVILAIALSAVSLYYYLQLLKQAFVVETAPSFGNWSSGIVLPVTTTALALAVILAGCFPQLILKSLAGALQLAH